MYFARNGYRASCPAEPAGQENRGLARIGGRCHFMAHLLVAVLAGRQSVLFVITEVHFHASSPVVSTSTILA